MINYLPARGRGRVAEKYQDPSVEENEDRLMDPESPARKENASSSPRSMLEWHSAHGWPTSTPTAIM